MIPLERHQQILALVHERGVVSISELTERLAVSHMTIRRDLQKLEEQGNVLLVSGGVQSTERISSEPSHLDKSSMFSLEKQAIGKAAARNIPINSCIYLDAGTTTLMLAKELAWREDLLIVTNDFAIANYLIDNSQCRMLHTGGTLSRSNRSCVGETAAKTLHGLSIDIAFLSASCWNVRGSFTPDEEKISVKKSASHSSRKLVLLADSSKYNKVATFLALPLTRFDSIITDSHFSPAAQQEIAQLEVELVIATEIS
ncbi:DeoR/GlpR family DNA-binding transcription regulator [Rouxiella badensis]|uniref:DeoR/GlpR family DNA-binding transcription regulator n=1 Tax=Rouxiella TaxID=1565532 RepID=UPI0012646BE3|nr:MULTISPECIES: DeoR/GlpR family DNA-binding transcription regulator [Rouxiella]KAB7893387.1 DeoR family transcriptional regulator [Rouxiella sp. S1S-2]MCC3705286.1 DeoR/GlpR family DNA-binding transcription regulator [Rouxiella badensis]